VVTEASGCALNGTLGFLGASINMPPSLTLLDGMVGVTNDYKPTATFDGKVTGAAELGLGGKILAQLIHANTNEVLDALPHFKATMTVEWHWTLQQPVLAPTFKLDDIKMCVGRLFTHVLYTVLQRVERVLRPLEPLLGPTGRLLSPIPGTSVLFGHDVNTLQLLELFCRADCTFKNVDEALRIFQDIIKIYQFVQELYNDLGSDIDGCNIYTLVEKFVYDFRNDSLWVPDYPYNKADLYNVPPKYSKMSYYWSGFQRQGDFGIRFNLFENVPQNLINLIAGRSIPIAGVTVPDFTLAAGAGWSFLIWYPPQVWLFLNLYAGMTFSLKEVALMSDGIIRAFQTKNVAALFGGLAVPVKNDDGSVHQLVVGQFSVTGGLDVRIGFVFEL
jgi:hypothetical protein